MLSHDTLAIIWFGLWGLIWTLYFVLDGYTLGTGMLFPFIAKKDSEESQLQDAVGPFWGGNEVWLITAGGATFAAFPLTYALMFSYLYTPLMLILFALFFRATGLEFMGKHDSLKWKNFWKWAFFTSSLLISFLFGVTFANLYYGLPFNNETYYGTLIDLLNPYGLLGGLLFTLLFMITGSLWISLKTIGDVKTRALNYANKLWLLAMIIVGIFIVATKLNTTLFNNFSKQPLLYIVPALSLLLLIVLRYFIKKEYVGRAFTTISISIFALSATGFIGLFPNMLVARDQSYNVTLFEAAGSQLNLQLMFIVTLIFVPIIIAYQIFMHRIFKDKITPDNAKGYK